MNFHHLPLAPKPAPIAAAIACLAMAAPQTVAAQTTEPTFDIGRVTITGARIGPLSSRRLLTSVDSVNSEVLGSQTTQATWELFSMVPGALLTNFNQGTTSGKVSLRAFNGEGEVNAVKLLIDGVPSNSNDGNMPYLDAVFPLELQAIEVVRGTNDARYGQHNIAGNVNLATRRGGNATLARVAAGTFGSTDVQLAKGIESESWTQNYFIGDKRSDGWRDHADSKKTVLSGQWFYKDPAWTAGVTARHFTHDAQEPGYLTRADAAANPRQSYPFSATDGGERRVNQLAVHLDARATDDLTATARAYVNHFDDDRWVKFSASVSQQERVTDEKHVGGRVSLSWKPRVSSLHAFALEGGFDLESQDNRSLRYNSLERAPVTQTRDQAWTFNTYGAYLQAVVEPVPGLKFVPGWRIDQLAGNFSNKLAGTTAAINDYGTINQPKLSAVWSPLPEASLYGNWGRTFQVGVGAAAYKIPPRTADLKASINDGWETGVKFAPTTWLDGRLAGWQQKATDEVRRRLNDPSGDSDNIGATRRRGIDLQLALHPTSTLDAWVAWTCQKAVIVTPDPAAPLTAGKEIDHVPRRVVNAGIDWAPAADWKLSASVQGQSAYYLERTNSTGQFGAYTVLNLGATWQVTPSLRFETQLRNATKRQTEYVWHDGTQSLHSPGAPRAISLALSASL